MQCPVCSNLAPAALDSLQGRQRATVWIVVGNLRSSAKSCAECDLVLRALSIWKNEWFDDENDRSIEVRLSKDLPALIYYRPETLYLEVFKGPSVEHSGSVAPGIGRGPVVAEYSGSEESLSLASQWLTDCLETHQLCQPATSSTLPTRVLDVATDHDASSQVKLTDGGHCDDPYLALSYCWGKPETDRMLKTTSDNIDSHRKAIELRELPPTLRDAVSLTRRLGYRYLWIDALCIIQDDKEDWAREAARMRSVYANAAVTIIASGSPGSSSGLFGHQSYSDAHELSYRDTSPLVRKELARDHVDFDILEGWPWDNEPIASRAWTLQEAVLSNRSLLFTTFELKWMCNEWRKCECGSLDAEMDAGDIGDLRTLRLSNEVSKLTPLEAYRKWTDVVLVYSKRQMSYESDKLPALSGLAQQFARLLNECFGREDTYLAGIWKMNLPFGLLWELDDYRNVDFEVKPFMFARRPSTWRAPTWSWASIDGAITQPPYLNMESCVEVVDCETVPDGIDPYGQVRSASLTLKGRLIEHLKISCREEGNLQGVPPSAKRNLTPGPSGSVIWKRTHILSRQDGHFVNFSPDCAADLDDGNLEACALLVGKQRIADQYVFLVLRKGSSGEEAVYERIGVAIHRGSDSFDPAGFATVLEHASPQTVKLV